MAKILVVDDDPMSLELLCEFLVDRGHSVVRSTAAASAASLAVEHEPELVVLDYQMPGMSGTEVLAQLRAAAATRGLPVVMLSGQSAFSYSSEVPKEERVRFLHKPVDFPLLALMIDDLMRRTR